MGLLSQLVRAGIRAHHDVRRAKARIEYFNWRWHKLVNIHQLVVNDFLKPLQPVSANMSATEYAKLTQYTRRMDYWHEEINQNINQATQKHLSQYATSIKNVAMTSMKLCKKYGVYSDIESLEYVSTEKTIYLNGEQHYTFT
jgi:hypothetical protein